MQGQTINLISDALSGAGVDECVQLPCDSFPCLNGATCSNVGDDYRCICAVGFTGAECEWEITPCLLAGHRCLNHGECLPITDGYQCVCPLDSNSSNAFVGLTCNECEFFTKVLECVGSYPFSLAKPFSNAQVSAYGFLSLKDSELTR